ncbi:uncharacterized protein FOBCDRAFT_280823 [Fusarium oxysporum Fo47]|uniref:uncharacterized protein n=1 Tax=Fusarium oxysporum Fo47 TaxID=660027 RepID=UPI0028699B9C|nr:uncharacterized protein FOBCDRAFT_280823 [Fusarium oxysporum Fo47]QKD61193.2 hypothetical protein FOBCDRAFT_280823 [Fusarium oxysporum Fo47]
MGPEQDRNSVEVIRKVLDYDTPDLVVLNDDLINGDSTYAHNSTHYIDQIVEPLVNRSLTWASNYGNHDHNYNIAGDDILDREQMWPGSRTQKMVNETMSGTTNYYLAVYPANCSDTTDCSPRLLLWFFDSRGGNYYQAFREQVGVRKNYQPGINDDPPVPQQGYGWCANGTPSYDCLYGGQDVHFMEALVTIPRIIGLF